MRGEGNCELCSRKLRIANWSWTYLLLTIHYLEQIMEVVKSHLANHISLSSSIRLLIISHFLVSIFADSL